MRVIFAEQMKQIDRLTQEQFSVPGLLLMERAALTVLETMEARFGNLENKHIYICCGKGNNGGDGLALARLLREKAVNVTVIMKCDPNLLQGLAAQNFDLAVKFGVRFLQWSELPTDELKSAEIIVDALLGTGAIGKLSDQLVDIIDTINNLGKPVVAVDIPTGVGVDNGQVSNTAIRATFTVTFGLPKPGLLCYPGAEYAGEVFVKQVGFPKQLLEDEAIDINFLSEPEIRQLLPKRPYTAHKGTNGHLLAIGGSPGMNGAIALAGLAALRTGCGLVTVGLRQGSAFFEKPVEVMVTPWPELLHRWGNFQSVVFGPGLSKEQDGESFLYEVLEHNRAPLIIDADGLNLLASNLKLVNSFKQPVVLTPHPGEMARLIGSTISEVQADRIGTARHYAKEWQVTIVLKGARTIIAAPDGRIFINSTGNSGMATAGTGDILAGMIGGLIAQGLEVTNAAVAGVYLHGLAGDLAASNISPIGIIASDLITNIAIAIKKVSTF
jgi:NAD(P)H-hydrate epimerase